MGAGWEKSYSNLYHYFMERKYYIASGKEHFGAFTISELQEKNINPNTLIWYEGLEQWTRADEIAELKSCIVSIPVPPPTPIEIDRQSNKEKRNINILIQKRLLSKAGEKTLGLLLIFALFIGFGLIIGKKNIFKENVNIDISILILYFSIQLIIIAVISFIVFYFIERQKPYKGLLKFDDIYYKKENEIYTELIAKQAEKYFFNVDLSYLDLSYFMPAVGFIILFFNSFLGFFPEIKIWTQPDYSEFINPDYIEIILLLTIGFTITRVICCITVCVDAYNKMRNYLLWGIFSFVFPSIGMILVGSFYPKNDKNIICPKCGKLKNRSNLYCDECLKKLEPKAEQSKKDDDFF